MGKWCFRDKSWFETRLQELKGFVEDCPATMYHSTDLSYVHDSQLLDGKVLGEKTNHPYRFLAEYVTTHGEDPTVPSVFIAHSKDFGEDIDTITRSVVFALFFRYLSSERHIEYVHLAIRDLFQHGYLHDDNSALWSTGTLEKATLELGNADYASIVRSARKHAVQDFIDLVLFAQRGLAATPKGGKRKKATRRRKTKRTRYRAS